MLRHLFLSCAAALSAQTPATGVDYVVPAESQPYTTDAETVWYDSFDDPAFPQKYFEFVAQNGFGHTAEEAFGGSGGSLKGVFGPGTVSAGSLKLAFGDSPIGRIVARRGEKFTHVYWRIYVKHARGWTGNPAKLSRATIIAAPKWEQAMIAHVWGGRGDYLTLDPATGIDANGQLATRQYNDFDRLRWLGNQPPAGYPIFATEESGRWVCVEAAAKLNTPGEADGTFELWIDGRLDSYRDRLNWRGAWDERGINNIFLENYWNEGSPVEQARYFDDFVVSTKPVGLARAPRNPEVVLTDFDGQAGYQMQVAVADQIEIVWDSGMRNGASRRVRVDSAGGRFRGTFEGRGELEADTRYAVRVRVRDRSGNWTPWSRWRLLIHTVAG